MKMSANSILPFVVPIENFVGLALKAARQIAKRLNPQ
jgi:hypothetical protein